ncbi:MAG: MerR family transcriptional regulator [Flavobacteriales bacterium]
MPTIENQSLSKLYYSIGEVAELLQVNASLLRFWEKEFNLSVSKKNKKGNRLYTAKEIEKIQRIYQFVKIEGYTLEGAKKALKTKAEPQIVEQNEVAITSNEGRVASSPSIASIQQTSNIDTIALISKLEAIKKRLLYLNLEEVSNATIASMNPPASEHAFDPSAHPEKPAAVSLENQNEAHQSTLSTNVKPRKPKSEAKPKPSTDAPTLFDF